ncbi:glycosyl transferase [Piscinibacter sp.]|uniref:glycosyl transferase n=1 Tax=Piscinibacter sp. TaxID=1903157 RepID=UPI0039E30DE5
MSTAAVKQLVCVKWGTMYGPEYVNRLYGMVSRHITGPFRLVCLTDDRSGIRAEVECLALPELGCPHPQRTMGKWRKQILWGATVPGLETGKPALFIDLDSVIVGPLDDYFRVGDPQDVYVARNWARPLEKLGQTSVFRFPVGGNAHVLEDFRADPQGIADKHGFEQHYVTHAVTGGVKFWPEAWTRHFRLHCLPPFPLRYFMTARLPAGTRIVTFPGGPNPDDVIEGRWNKRVPPRRSRWAHVMATFGGGARVDDNWRRHLQRYVLPVAWIAAAWRE